MPAGRTVSFTILQGILARITRQVGLLMAVGRLVLVMQVMSAGISLPQAYLRRQWKSIAILLGPVMLSACLVTSTLVYLFFWDLINWVKWQAR